MDDSVTDISLEHLLRPRVQAIDLQGGPWTSDEEAAVVHLCIYSLQEA